MKARLKFCLQNKEYMGKFFTQKNTKNKKRFLVETNGSKIRPQIFGIWIRIPTASQPRETSQLPNNQKGLNFSVWTVQELQWGAHRFKVIHRGSDQQKLNSSVILRESLLSDSYFEQFLPSPFLHKLVRFNCFARRVFPATSPPGLRFW